MKKGLLKCVAGITVLCFALSMFGCATRSGTGYQPVIDTGQVRDYSLFQRDLAECKQIAESPGNTGESAIGGAVVGAAAGAAVGLALGILTRKPLHGLAAGSALGGIGGAGAGASGGIDMRNQIYRSCMSGRGYQVLY